MCSGMQCREFGLGLRTLLSPDVLETINSNREGTRYTSELDAQIVYNNVYKRPLTDDPAMRFFDAGANRDGYWTCSHLKLQIEDLVDCLKVIFPNFDYTILLDQSSGHCKVREDGLVINRMNVSYGGRLNNMRDTIVPEVGTFPSILTPGDTQTMHFKDNNIGPFWLSNEERLAQKYNVSRNTVTTRNRTKTELLMELNRKGCNTTLRRFTKD